MNVVEEIDTFINNFDLVVEVEEVGTALDIEHCIICKNVKVISSKLLVFNNIHEKNMSIC